MSGIAVLLARGGAAVDGALLDSMVAAQRFRGPDGAGLWRQGSIGLAHTLHKATLEAEREPSPARLGERLVIAADARLDARDELCARLRDHGSDVAPDLPDPELILHAYEAWSDGCLPHLLGDFSFALWDAPRRRLVCAVDPLGVKPFYYADRGGLFAGSNTLACVRLHPTVRDQLNDVAVADFLLAGCYQQRDITILADVARIPPGHLLIVDEDGARLRRYFDWPEPAEVRWRRPADCVDAFEELLARAVRDRLRTPKAAVLMSGGLDSPLVARTAKRELAARFSSPELAAYCCVYDRLIPDDERRHAELAARSLSIPIDIQPMDDGQLYDWVGRLSPAEPFGEVGVGPYLDQMARLAARFSVVLTGYDGDALLDAAVRLHWRERIGQRRLGALGRDLVWYVTQMRALPPIGVRTYLARRRRGAAEPPSRPSWLREELWRRAGLEQRYAPAHSRTPVATSRQPSARSFASPGWALVFDGYDPSHTGRPIEVRHPLADLRLIRFAFGLSAVPWCVDKHLLRICLRDLPAEIRKRPKTPLGADHAAELLRRRGLGPSPPPWQSPGLSAFVDVRVIEKTLKSRSLPDAKLAPGELWQLWPLLRAVSLGAWLAGRAPSCVALARSA
jgi:asparagine synthase (glutamine-hydrolysing)